jgi:hypothetical protein
MTKKLYTAFSFPDFIWLLILRLACIFGILYFASVYNENPPVILFLIIVCIILVFVLGNNQIVVYSDKIIQTDSSFLSLFFKTENQTYLIGDIKSAYIPKKHSSSKTEIGVAAVLIFLLPRQRSKLNKSFLIFLNLKNGETKKIETSLGERKMNDVVKDINSLVKTNNLT